MKKVLLLVFVILFLSQAAFAQTLPSWLQIKDDPFIDPMKRPYLAAGDGITDDTAALQNALNAAESAGKKFLSSPNKLYKITSSLVLPPNIDVDFSNSTILNYSGTHALIASETISGEISNLRITYQNYGTALNTKIPPWSRSTTVAHGYQRVFNHITSGFVGAGVRAYLEGGGPVRNLKNVTVKYHYYGFLNCGWLVKYDNCTANSNSYGFYADAVSVSGTAYLPNAYYYNRCIGLRNSVYGVYHKYGAQVKLQACDFEKNFTGNYLAYIDGLTVDGCYFEFSRGYVLTLARIRGGSVTGTYFGANADSHYVYGTSASLIETFTATAGQTVFTVSGITSFSSMDPSDVLVVANNAWVAPTAWSKSGSNITFSSGVASGTIVDILGSAVYDTSYSEYNDAERFELGAYAGVLVQSCHSITLENNHFYSPIHTTISVNDAVLGITSTNILEQNNYHSISRTGYEIPLSSSFNSNSSNGVFRENVIFAGLQSQYTTDLANLVTKKISNLTIADTATATYTMESRYSALTLLGTFGAVILTAPPGDSTASITASLYAPGMVDVSDTNPATANRLNIYSVSPGVIGFDNRLGYDMKFRIIETYPDF